MRRVCVMFVIRIGPLDRKSRLAAAHRWCGGENYGRDRVPAPSAPRAAGQPQRREGIIAATSPAVRVRIIVVVPYRSGRICRCKP